MSVRKSRENYRQMYGKSKASLWRNLSTGAPPNFFKDNPLSCSFSLQLIFFGGQPFYGNYSTLDSHTNTVISHTFAYSSRWRRKPWQGLLNYNNWIKIFYITYFIDALTFGGHFEICGRQVQEQGLVPSWDSPKFGKISEDPIACKVQWSRSERLRSALVEIFLGPVACVAGRFCQSPRGVSALARLFYFARPTKTAMLRRLLGGGGLATFRPIHLQPKPRAAKTIESKNRSVERNLWHPVFTMAWLVLCDKIWDNLAQNGFIQGWM